MSNDQLKQEKTATVGGYVKFAETKEGQKGPYRRCRVVFGKDDNAEWVTIRLPLELLEQENIPDPEKGDFIKVTGLLTVFGEPGEAYIFAQKIENFVEAKDIPDNRPVDKEPQAPANKSGGDTRRGSNNAPTQSRTAAGNGRRGYRR